MGKADAGECEDYCYKCGGGGGGQFLGVRPNDAAERRDGGGVPDGHGSRTGVSPHFLRAWKWGQTPRCNTGRASTHWRNGRGAWNGGRAVAGGASADGRRHG